MESTVPGSTQFWVLIYPHLKSSISLQTACCWMIFCFRQILYKLPHIPLMWGGKTAGTCVVYWVGRSRALETETALCLIWAQDSDSLCDPEQITWPSWSSASSDGKLGKKQRLQWKLGSVTELNRWNEYMYRCFPAFIPRIPMGATAGFKQKTENSTFGIFSGWAVFHNMWHFTGNNPLQIC